MLRRPPVLMLLCLVFACARTPSDSDRATKPQLTAPVASATAGTTSAKAIKAFYFGHSLLAGSHASPNYHIPYNIGLFAAAKGIRYETHGQLGWGTPIAAHWGWTSDDLADGPQGFSSENLEPFYAGRNGKAELAKGGYNLVAFTDVNGNAKGARKEPVVEALVGFIQLARKQSANVQPVLYSCWNELPVTAQANRAAVEAWRAATLAELSWWEGVAEAVNAKVAAPRMLLVPVSAVIAEIALAAADASIPGPGAPKSASALFTDDVHGTPLTYYAAAAALYAAIFQEAPPAATSEVVRGNVGGAAVEYTLPSVEVAGYLQQRALEIVRDYPRAGWAR